MINGLLKKEVNPERQKGIFFLGLASLRSLQVLDHKGQLPLEK
jgi:hypothetical protein